MVSSGLSKEIGVRIEDAGENESRLDVWRSADDSNIPTDKTRN